MHNQNNKGNDRVAKEPWDKAKETYMYLTKAIRFHSFKIEVLTESIVFPFNKAVFLVRVCY